MNIDDNNYQINSIDWARIIGIYLVILGHMQYCGLNMYIKNFIYLFHMPLFFFISGMLHKNSFNKSVNNLCGMIILFFLFNFPFYVNSFLHGYSINLTSNIPTWFFITLGIIKISLYNITLKKAILFIGISMLSIQIIHSKMIEISSFIYVKSIFMSIPFFISGYYLKKIIERKYNLFFMVLCFVVLIFATKIYGRVDVFQGVFKYYYLDYYFVAMCGIFCVIQLANRLPLIDNKIFWNISRGTAVLVGCHYMLCVKTSLISIHNFLLPFIYSIIIIIIYPLIFLAINKYPILIGKINLLK